MDTRSPTRALALCALVASQLLAAGTAAPASCADVFDLGHRASGMYSISPGTGVDGQEKRLHCAFDTARGVAWTLVRSFTRAEGAYGGVLNTTLFANTPINDGDAEVSRATAYSLGNADMAAVGAASGLFMMGCNFDVSQTRDYVLVNTSDFNPLVDRFEHTCVRVLAIELRGEGGCTDCSVPFWHSDVSAILYPIHIDSAAGSCGSAGSIGPGAVSSEDNFGFYEVTNPKHACTANSASTTQHWFGALVDSAVVQATPIARRSDTANAGASVVLIDGNNDAIEFGADSAAPLQVWRTLLAGAPEGGEDIAALVVGGKLIVDGVDVLQELNRTREALIEFQKRAA